MMSNQLALIGDDPALDHSPESAARLSRAFQEKKPDFFRLFRWGGLACFDLAAVPGSLPQGLALLEN